MSECEIIASEVIVPETGKTKYVCELCNISFSVKGNLNKHLRKFHQLQVLVREQKIICAVCNEKLSSIARLHEHLQNLHSIFLEFSEEIFYSEKDFVDWKNKIERESLSSYVLRYTSHKIKGITTAHYTCHRSGSYQVKQNRIRNLKAPGSKKTGSTCPAGIKISAQTVDGISEIKVQYQSVHLGHDLDSRALRLTKLERKNLAGCLKLGISMDKTLEETKQNSSPTNRFRYLAQKHLLNIRKDFGIPISYEKPKTNRHLHSIHKDKIPINNKKNQKASAHLNNICGEYEITMNNEKFQEISTLQNAVVESSNSSIGNEDCIEVSNHEEIKKHEKSSAISSLLLQNNNCHEEFSGRKLQIVNKLKELQLRIEEWDPKYPLPDVEDHIRAMTVFLDISGPSNRTVNFQGSYHFHSSSTK